MWYNIYDTQVKVLTARMSREAEPKTRALGPGWQITTTEDMGLKPSVVIHAVLLTYGGCCAILFKAWEITSANDSTAHR